MSNYNTIKDKTIVNAKTDNELEKIYLFLESYLLLANNKLEKDKFCNCFQFRLWIMNYNKRVERNIITVINHNEKTILNDTIMDLGEMFGIFERNPFTVREQVRYLNAQVNVISTTRDLKFTNKLLVLEAFTKLRLGLINKEFFDTFIPYQKWIYEYENKIDNISCILKNDKNKTLDNIICLMTDKLLIKVNDLEGEYVK